jgi:hypothetical protein
VEVLVERLVAETLERPEAAKAAVAVAALDPPLFICGLVAVSEVKASGLLSAEP